MDRREYTPTKVSQITAMSTRGKGNVQLDRSGYAGRATDSSIMRDYQGLKAQVRQWQTSNRQLSNQIERLRYERNINQNKYLQKVSSQQQAMSQFQKQKNYELQLLKIRNEQQIGKMRRQYQFKIDDLQRICRNHDYHNRQSNEKNSYIQLKINQLTKGIAILQTEHTRFREANQDVNQLLIREQRHHQKLLAITEELQKQKTQMESEIHVLLDIEAEKSRTANALEIQLRNQEANQRNLHQKLAMLTQNFENLEQHINVMKERLLASDIKNQQLEQQLQHAEFRLGEKGSAVVAQKQLEVRLRQDLEREQIRQTRRQRQIEELIAQNQRLMDQLNMNRLKLKQRCGGSP